LALLAISSSVLAQTCNPDLTPASTPDSQLKDNGDGTITDTKTGLMWKQCVEGRLGKDCREGALVSLTWQQAKQRAKSVNNGGGFAGHREWRVPTIKELNSLVERQCAEPAINLSRFPSTLDVSYWSSSVFEGNTDAAWTVVFKNGEAAWYFKDSAFLLRLVRTVN